MTILLLLVLLLAFLLAFLQALLPACVWLHPVFVWLRRACASQP